MHRRLRYRIYPTKAQVATLTEWQNGLRFLWNLAHQQRLECLARYKKTYVNYYDQGLELKDLRQDLDWFARIPTRCTKEVLRNLDSAWRACFLKTGGKPKFKSRGRKQGLTMSDRWSIKNSRLQFTKQLKIRIRQHRPLEGKPKSATILQDGDQWFVSIVCELPDVTPKPSTLPPVGIDRGVVNTIADSTGRVVRNPRHYEKAMAKLARAQRKLAKKKKGSNNRQKQKIKVQRIHRKIRNQRSHFLHCESKYYAKSHGTVVLEDLKTSNMLKANRGLSRSIAGASWYTFEQMLTYKLQAAGGTVVKVDPRYTSQQCSVCGQISKANRKSQHEFVCTQCGHECHADINAARNILSRHVDGVTACGGLRSPSKQEIQQDGQD